MRRGVRGAAGAAETGAPAPPMHVAAPARGAAAAATTPRPPARSALTDAAAELQARAMGYGARRTPTDDDRMAEETAGSALRFA